VGSRVYSFELDFRVQGLGFWAEGVGVGFGIQDLGVWGLGN
jgi:hypothetical protein